MTQADDTQPCPSENLLSRLERHRQLGLHDAVIDDLNDMWHATHPDGAEPWDEP